MIAHLLCWLLNGGHRYGAPTVQNWRARYRCVRCGHVRVEEIR